MKKVLIFVILFLTCCLSVDATTGTVVCTDGDTSPLRIRGSIENADAVGWLACNSTVEILEENVDGGIWHKVKLGDIVGYSSSEYIVINKATLNLKGQVSCVENDDPLSVRDNVSGTIIDRLACNVEMDIIDDKLGKNGLCDNWYKVSYGDNKIGYVCGTYVKTYVDVDFENEDVKLYRNSLFAAGFPESYLDDLVRLHAQYPNWIFIPFNTGLDWNTVIDNESIKNRNLVYKTYGIGYRSTEPYSYNPETDEFYRHPTEENWWYASRAAIEYYMDPRNYLNSKNMFSFETLSYEPSFQTSQIVDKIMGSSFMPIVYNKYSEDSYITAFMDAATTYGVSPVHLASRIIQEQSMDGSIASLGGVFNYNNQSYSGYFNFYNIKATGENPAVQGLVWAMGGLEQTGTSYGRPWNSPYKSIMGGAQFLSEDYISVGQNTLYFQKFDVSTNDGHYNHQYMQNITAPLTEGVDAYSGYSSIDGILDEALVFIIPVYNNMPDSRIEAPSNKSSNAYLSNIKINNNLIEGFTYNKFDYNMEVSSDVLRVDITASTVNSGALIEGIGSIELNEGENKIEVNVTAENGNVNTYIININRQVKNENIVLSNVNTLKSIIIDKISFEFNKDILEYNLETDFNTNKIFVSYEPEDDNASVKTESEIDLVVGVNKINISVTALNGEERIYILNITRKKAELKEILNNSGIKYNDKYVYGIKVDTSIDSLINNIKSISNSVSVVIKDNNDNNKTGVFATGDKVVISDGVDTLTYEVVIYGDANGDALIDKLDYLAILRHYYKYKEYTGVYKESLDVNRDGVIDKLDCLAVLRDFYGYKKIEQ